jgi:hypothetical protein
MGLCLLLSSICHLSPSIVYPDCIDRVLLWYNSQAFYSSNVAIGVEILICKVISSYLRATTVRSSSCDRPNLFISTKSEVRFRKREEMAWLWRKQSGKELYYLHCLLNVITVIKLRKLSSMVLVSRARNMKHIQNFRGVKQISNMEKTALWGVP